MISTPICQSLLVAYTALKVTLSRDSCSNSCILNSLKFLLRKTQQSTSEAHVEQTKLVHSASRRDNSTGEGTENVYFR